jgi:hypothetical protein
MASASKTGTDGQAPPETEDQDAGEPAGEQSVRGHAAQPHGRNLAEVLAVVDPFVVKNDERSAPR